MTTASSRTIFDTESDEYPRPQNVSALNRDEAWLRPHKAMFNSIKKAFDEYRGKFSSLIPVGHYISPGYNRTPQGIYIVCDEYGVWRNIWTPAGSVRLTQGGLYKDQKTLSKTIAESVDWELEEVGSSIEGYVYFEQRDTVRGPFEQPGKNIFWVRRIGSHHAPTVKPDKTVCYLALTICEDRFAFDTAFFEE